MNRKEISEKLNKTYKSMISSDFDSVVHKIKNKKGVLLDMAFTNAGGICGR